MPVTGVQTCALPISMTQLQGSERGKNLVDGMERERAAQRDPNVRAERFLVRWNGLEQEHARLGGWEQEPARQKIEAQMRAVAGEIGKDAGLEAALRQRQIELGIDERSRLGRALREKDVGHSLEQRLSHRERERDHGLEM